MKGYIPIKGVKFALPENGRVLVFIENGKMSSAELLRPDQQVASLAVLLELAGQAGYRVTKPELD